MDRIECGLIGFIIGGICGIAVLSWTTRDTKVISKELLIPKEIYVVENNKVDTLYEYQAED